MTKTRTRATTRPVRRPTTVAPAVDIQFDQRSPEMEQRLAQFYRLLANGLPPGWGFAIQLFQTTVADAQTAPVTFYISSVNQAATRQILARLVEML